MDARDIDWRRYDQLKAQGRSGRQIAQDIGVAESTLRGALKRRQTPRALPVQRSVQSTDTSAVPMHPSSAVQVPVQTSDSDIEILRR